MSPTSSPAPSSGDDRNLVTVDENYLAPTFEDRLRLFWAKNSRAVLAAIALVLVVILGKGAYEIISARREKAIAADYVAATTDAGLTAFIAAHPGHVLGGLAQLRLADTAYAAGRHAEARAAYDRAAGILKNTTFGRRARLGAAVSAVQAGAETEGKAALALLSADLALEKIVRAEAAYHLASLAALARDTAESIRLIEQIMVIDPQGPWAERAALLRATLPTPAAASASNVENIPAVSFK